MSPPPTRMTASSALKTCRRLSPERVRRQNECNATPSCDCGTVRTIQHRHRLVPHRAELALHRNAANPNERSRRCARVCVTGVLNLHRDRVGLSGLYERLHRLSSGAALHIRRTSRQRRRSRSRHRQRGSRASDRRRCTGARWKSQPGLRASGQHRAGSRRARAGR